jgi:hypothetical protein
MAKQHVRLPPQREVALRRRPTMRPLFEFRRLAAVTSVVSCLFIATGASASYISDFESLSGSAAGTVLTGQDGWYNPVSGSADYRVYTYAGNAIGMPANPTGGAQFIGGSATSTTVFARGQHDEAFPNPVSGLYTFELDFCGKFTGTPPAVNNLGSFSIQPSSGTAANGQAIAPLFSWMPGFEGTFYRASYLAYDAAGAAMVAPGGLPGAAWDNLSLDHWYRATTIVDFNINRIIEVRIKDLTTNTTTSFIPPDWYMHGGSAGPGQQPTGFRCFTGGGLGNHMGFDNLNVQPGAATPVLAGTWGGIKATFANGNGGRTMPAPPRSQETARTAAVSSTPSPTWPRVD